MLLTSPARSYKYTNDKQRQATFSNSVGVPRWTVRVTSVVPSLQCSIALNQPMKHESSIPFLPTSVHFITFVTECCSWRISGQLSLLPSATGWSVADWGGGMSASCKPQVQLFAETQAMDGRIMRCGIISSCQSAVTSEIVKRFWSRVWLT